MTGDYHRNANQWWATTVIKANARIESFAVGNYFGEFSSTINIQQEAGWHSREL